MERLSYLGFAVAFRRVGMVYVVGDDIKYWRMSTKAATDSEFAIRFAARMIDRWQPDVVVTEQSAKARHKGVSTKHVIDAITAVADASLPLNAAVGRSHDFKNKYEEAAALVQQYPKLASIQPKPRRFFDCEPRVTVVFEALSLIDSIKQSPTPQLAAAMG